MSDDFHLPARDGATDALAETDPRSPQSGPSRSDLVALKGGTREDRGLVCRRR